MSVGGGRGVAGCLFDVLLMLLTFRLIMRPAFQVRGDKKGNPWTYIETK